MLVSPWEILPARGRCPLKRVLNWSRLVFLPRCLVFKQLQRGRGLQRKHHPLLGRPTGSYTDTFRSSELFPSPVSLWFLNACPALTTPASSPHSCGVLEQQYFNSGGGWGCGLLTAMRNTNPFFVLAVLSFSINGEYPFSFCTVKIKKKLCRLFTSLAYLLPPLWNKSLVC